MKAEEERERGRETVPKTSLGVVTVLKLDREMARGASAPLLSTGDTFDSSRMVAWGTPGTVCEQP